MIVRNYEKKFHKDKQTHVRTLGLNVPENYMKLAGKCPGIIENMAPIFAHMVLLNRGNHKILLYRSLRNTLYT